MSVVPDKSFFRPELIVIDVPYSPLETKMRSMAKEVGCKTMNGLGMMLFQEQQPSSSGQEKICQSSI